MDTADVSVILPCAGAGSRFGAPYPKELHMLSTGAPVIDEALSPVLTLVERGLRVRLVVVISASKMDTLRYLSRYAERMEVTSIYQHSGDGLEAAIESAIPLCTGPTMLILPDQHMQGPSAAMSLVRAIDLLTEHPVAVIAAPMTDADRLREEGALRIVRRRGAHEILDAAEKPSDPTGYNSAWVALAVSPEYRDRLSAVAQSEPATLMKGAPAVLVASFHNLTRACEQ